MGACSICNVEADWVRVRMPNKEQMTYLCHRHYQSLQARNPTLADYYDALVSVDPMEQAWPNQERVGSLKSGLESDSETATR